VVLSRLEDEDIVEVEGRRLVDPTAAAVEQKPAKAETVLLF
jgi:hypothetical protein